MLCSVVKHAGNSQSTNEVKEKQKMFSLLLCICTPMKYVVPANQDACYMETLS